MILLWDDHLVAGVITASEPSWMAPFAGLSPRSFGKLVAALRREGADLPRRGRPWGLPFEDRVLLVAAYWRTNLTMRQLAPLFGVSPATVCRVIQRLGPLLAVEPVRAQTDAVQRLWTVDGTLIPVRDRSVAASSRNYRFSANVQVIVDADTRIVVAAARPVPGTTADAHAWRASGLAGQCEGVTLLGDGAYLNCGMAVPHRKRPRTGPAQGREGRQRRPPQGPRPGRACDRPDEELQDPP